MKTYKLPDLPYEYTSLQPVYSSELLELHHDKHHAGYVKGANAALEALARARAEGDFEHINELQKDLAFNVSGHVLHSLFWRNMSPEGHDIPDGELARHIERDLGGLDAVREHMSEAAINVQGSGWAVLAWEPVAGRLIVEQVYDHQGNIANGAVPLLALDMWEHAYYLQYRNAKADWVKSFWEIANWKEVAQRFEKARRAERLSS